MSIARFAFVAAGCALVAGAAHIAFAGGWGIFADLPRSTDDPRLAGSVLTFSAAGGMARGTVVTATAEGMVNGVRVSQPLHPTVVEREARFGPMYGVRREWPSEGKWVLSIKATHSIPSPAYRTSVPTNQNAMMMETRLFIPLLPDGTPQTRATPGGKYDHFLVTVIPKRGDQGTTLTRLLMSPRATAVAAAGGNRP